MLEHAPAHTQGAAAGESCAAHARAACALRQTDADPDRAQLLACQYYLQAPASASAVGCGGAWSPLQRERGGAWSKYVQVQDMAAPHGEPHGHSSGVQMGGHRSMTCPITKPGRSGGLPRHTVLPERLEACCRSGAVPDHAQADLRDFLREWGIFADELSDSRATALRPSMGPEHLNTQSEQAQALLQYTQILA